MLRFTSLKHGRAIRKLTWSLTTLLTVTIAYR